MPDTIGLLVLGIILLIVALFDKIFKITKKVVIKMPCGKGKGGKKK